MEEEDIKCLEVHLEIIWRIQNKYKHSDETMLIIIDHVLHISNGILNCRYIEYIACMIIGEKIGTTVDLLKYLYNEKPLWQEGEKGLAAK